MAYFGNGDKTQIEKDDDCINCQKNFSCEYLKVLELRPGRRHEPILGCTDREEI